MVKNAIRHTAHRSFALVIECCFQYSFCFALLSSGIAMMALLFACKRMSKKAEAVISVWLWYYSKTSITGCSRALFRQMCTDFHIRSSIVHLCGRFVLLLSLERHYLSRENEISKMADIVTFVWRFTQGIRRCVIPLLWNTCWLRWTFSLSAHQSLTLFLCSQQDYILGPV